MTKKNTKVHGNTKEFLIVNKKAPFVRLTNFVEKYGIFSEYDKGVIWLSNNLAGLPLLEKEKAELKKILVDLFTFEKKGSDE